MIDHWNAEDKELLDILLMKEPTEEKKELSQPQDTQLFTVSLSPSSLLMTTRGKDSKLLRRLRHREVVKRAYHRKKAALKNLRDTVKELEEKIEKLSLFKHKDVTLMQKCQAIDQIQRRYELLTTEQEELGTEAARLMLVLNYRHQVATEMVTLVKRSVSISSDDLYHPDTDSDTAMMLSTTSVDVASSCRMHFDVNTPMVMPEVVECVPISTHRWL
ncbi:unnamed protein product [Peronospora belbahrii]|uniref:BZIP domain-containing protein n=1 Tax=Peronospora belbahrii TaxID=622444 RepID=A0AAU9KSR1_9STRA|nr:unnamed protein product [Peronospora belbahrii]CAH0517685.1 unnamed protein product [Peronospora belbahrii]